MEASAGRESRKKKQIWPQQEGIYLSPGSVGGGTQLSTSCNISCSRFLDKKHPRTNWDQPRQSFVLISSATVGWYFTKTHVWSFCLCLLQKHFSLVNLFLGLIFRVFLYIEIFLSTIFQLVNCNYVGQPAAVSLFLSASYKSCNVCWTRAPQNEEMNEDTCTKWVMLPSLRL